jgi:hypothetical protein
MIEGKFDCDNGSPGCLPGLTWISPGNQRAISEQVAKNCQAYWHVFKWGMEFRNDGVLTRLGDFDFRFVTVSPFLNDIVNWVHSHVRLYSPSTACFSSTDPFYSLNKYPLSGVVRIDPSDDFDFQLLKQMKAVTNQDMVKSAVLPVNWSIQVGQLIVGLLVFEISALIYYLGFRFASLRANTFLLDVVRAQS